MAATKFSAQHNKKEKITNPSNEHGLMRGDRSEETSNNSFPNKKSSVVDGRA
jgi:hypothetical protein